MKMLDSDLLVSASRQRRVSARAGTAQTLSHPTLAAARPSAIAPGLRELRLWELPPGAVGRCELVSSDRVTLTGVSGQCWVTLQGDRHDYLLAEGKTLVFAGPGRLVFEAVAESATIAVS